MEETISILYIEDNKFDQIALKESLSNSKFKIDIANTIESAKLLLNQSQLDIVIADHYLGDSTAFDLIEQVNDLEIPIIFLTGTGDEKIAIEALKKGVDDYLIKDVKDRNYLKVLPVVIERAINHKRHEKESRIMSHALMNSSDSIYITNDRDEILFVNHSFCSTYGYLKKEILGKESQTLWVKSEDFLNNFGLSPESLPLEIEHLKKDKSRFPVSISRSIVQDSIGDNLVVINISRDITSQKENQKKLSRAFKEISDIRFALDQHSIVAITDSKGVIIYANDKFCEISKYSKSELIGKTHRIINSGYHPESFFKEMWDTITRGNIWKGEVKNKSKLGDYYWANSTIVPFLDESNSPYQYVSIRTDITRCRESEKELLSGKEIIQEQNIKLRQLLHILSHDLINPLTFLSSIFELAEEDESLILEKKNEISSAVNNTIELIKNVKKIRALEENKIHFELQEVNLKEAVEESLYILNNKIEEKSIFLSHNIDKNINILVEKSSFINSVLNNLLTNAIKFSETGSQIKIDSSENEKKVFLTIKDSGIGIPMQLFPKIFSLTEVTTRPGTYGEQGTGFGMPLVKKFVDAFGGNIEIESIVKPLENHGTLVTITLPNSR